MGSQNTPDSSTLIASFAAKSAQDWQKEGDILTQNIFKQSVERVSAYPKFLADQGFSPENTPILSSEDFRKLPQTTKENFYDRYSLEELVREESFSENYLICTSSGSSGKPHYWPRFKDQDKNEPSMIEALYSFFNVAERSTLIISCLALGTWVAGNIMNDSSLEIARQEGKKISVITPGAQPKQILDIVRDLGHMYEQIIFIGYPPTIRTVIIDGIQEGIEWSKYNPKLVVGGEPVSQHWKDFMLEKIGSSNLLDIGVVFGMAEMHLVSFETPLAAVIRRELYKQPELSQRLFKTKNLGALLQFNPAMRWIEEENGELVISSNCGIPFVRYNTHDLGGVYQYSELRQILEESGISVTQLLQEVGVNEEEVWQWPFFYCHGRGDSVSLMGANIYPANMEAFFHKNSDFNDFKLSIQHNEDQKPQLCVYLELRAEKEINSLEENFTTQAGNEILELLTANNADYADALTEEPSSMTPHVMVYTYSEGPFSVKQMKQSHIFR